MIVTFARENGEPIMGGLTAPQYRDFKLSISTTLPDNFGNDPENPYLDKSSIISDYLISLCVDREYNILLKGKYENFQGENDLKFFAQTVIPLPGEEWKFGATFAASENRDLIGRLKLYERLAAQ
jgi:hypothetical protein